MAKPNRPEDAATFVPPALDSEEWHAWLDGPRPDAGNGRGQWLRARQTRDKWRRKEEERATAEAAAEAEAAKGEAQSRMVEPSGLDASRSPITDGHGHAAPGDADADVRTLDAIINTSTSLASDRIRAIEAKQRILARLEQEEREREHGPLIDLRYALEAIPEAERVAALGSLLGVEEAPTEA